MKVNVFDVIGPATKEYRDTCEIAECFLDDPDAAQAAIDEIKRCGQAWIGGGASPLVIMEKACGQY